MPNLVDRAAAIAEEAEKVLGQERAQDELARLNDAADRLTDAASTLEVLTALCRAMQQRRVASRGLPSTFEEVEAVMKTVEQQKWADASPVELDKTAVDCAAAIVGLTTRGRAEVQRAKDDWVTQQPSVGGSVLRALKPMAQQLVVAAARALDEAHRVSAEDVNDVDDVNTLCDAHARVGDLLDRLFAEVALPQQVRAFLEAVGTQGFPLSQMPDDVLTWLRDNDAAESFVVTLR